MQLSGPYRCERCEGGKMPGDKLCAVCRGSGWVYHAPAERPRTPDELKRSREMFDGLTRKLADRYS